MRENTDQENSEQGDFSRNVWLDARACVAV